ncbi:hypothetical protein E2C01_084906 [Portunus trituberculatus]|uniref:Uncharacterized protein n=1 Tax=Portunus trituberculatus TaxID=210409 RepID=A0A5B7J175_PORTR|nr:hypothetical protein [Portunus trituberculatus]
MQPHHHNHPPTSTSPPPLAPSPPSDNSEQRQIEGTSPQIRSDTDEATETTQAAAGVVASMFTRASRDVAIPDTIPRAAITLDLDTPPYSETLLAAPLLPKGSN